MNIAIDIRCLTERHRTGVGEYTYELLKHVFAEDREHSYYLFYNSYNDVSDSIPKFDYPNVHIISSRWPNKLFSLLIWLGWIKLDRFIEKRLNKKDNRTIQQYNNSNIQYFFAPNLNFISLGNQTKFILTIHDVSFALFKDLYSWRRRVWHRLVRPQKLAKRADVILTPSQNTMRDVMRVFGIEKNNIQVISPGVSSVETSVQSVSDIKTKYHLPDTYILNVCTLEPRKNIIALLESFSLLPKKLRQQYPLVLAGARGWNYKQIIQRIDETAYVHYIGYVDDDEKQALYNNATLFVFPSLYEGFGLPVLEAMQAGVPIITSNRPALTEVGGSAVYMVDPNNCADIARGMERLLKDATLRDIIITKQNAQVGVFRWDTSAKKCISLFS